MIKAGRVLLALTLGLSTFAPAMFAAESSSNPTVFVMTNASDSNEVVAYTRGSDGSFYETNRYATEGRGSGGTTDPLESQGSLTLSSDHSLLFAVNAGSGTLASFRVGRNGQLAFADKIATGGSEPLAVVSFQNSVYVLDGAGAGTVVGFSANQSGQLRAIKNSSAFLSATSAGGSSISITPDGTYLVVTERLTNNLDTFRVFSNGTLGPIQTIASPVPGVFAATFDPAGQLILSATGPVGGTNASTISSFAVSTSGALTAVTPSLPTFGNANCWNAVTPNGKFAYVSNSASSTISAFSIGQGGVLTPVGSTIVATQAAGSTNLDITVSGDGTYLYALNSMAGTVGVFQVNADGTLTAQGEISGLPMNVGFNGIAAP
ncbi:MAG: beta-propeller fold lactonase family protein [Acidobacteriaceae bacterium]